MLVSDSFVLFLQFVLFCRVFLCVLCLCFYFFLLYYGCLRHNKCLTQSASYLPKQPQQMLHNKVGTMWWYPIRVLCEGHLFLSRQ